MADKRNSEGLSEEELEALEIQRAKNRAKNRVQKQRERDARMAEPTYQQRMAQRRAARIKREKAAEEIARKKRARVERIRRAIDLYQGGMKKTHIARELSVVPETIQSWLKGVKREEPELEEPDPIQQALELESSEAIADGRLAARDEEQQALLENAEAHDKPADKYQAYMAASAIRLLRDNMPHVRGPRTVRELSELDQLIRRNLGLNPRGGSGGSPLRIDISILNNTKASKGAIGGLVLDAEEAEADS